MILGPDGRPLPPGQVGELAVRSRFIGTGYWEGPDETKSRFLTDPEDSTLYTFLTRDMGEILPDGSVFLHGRQDSMVKVRGSLVPLQDVEGALAALDGVEEAVVLASQQDDGNSSLVAYLRGASGGRKPLSQIRAAMAERLSSHMIPAAFVWMDQWPRLPSGKINKTALPKPGKSRAFHISEPAIEPRTPAEKAIASVWAEGLHLDKVGVDDNFLELGGDSLSAAVIAERLSRHFLTEIPATRVFESGTVSRLAAALAQAPVDETLEQLLREVESLSPEEVKRLLAENGA
jgi:acyl carrier protein